MHRLFTAALAVSALVPSLAMAQGMGEVRRGQQEVRQGQQEVRRDMARGDRSEAHKNRQAVREDRRELREDWRDYRQSHREVFRGSRYNPPRGYSYRAVSVGYSFRPVYYSSRYWISDPMRYRLSAPGRYQRWIRYGNDVILINTRNGRVLRVYRDFFW